MDCKAVENLFEEFVEYNLDDKRLGEFIVHVEGCSSCSKELHSQYAVLSALYQIDNNLEFSEDYDLELQERFDKFKAKKRRVIREHIIFYITSSILAFFITLIFSVIFLNKEDIKYLNSKEESTIAFEVNGYPEKFDPIDLDIKKYNKEIINYIHSGGGNDD